MTSIQVANLWINSMMWVFWCFIRRVALMMMMVIMIQMMIMVMMI